MMRRFLLIILLTILADSTLCATHDSTKVKIIVTVNYGGELFGKNPAYGTYPFLCTPQIATYIKSHRAATPEGCFALKNIGSNINCAYRLFPANIAEQIESYLGYDKSELITLAGKTFGFIQLDADLKSNRENIRVFIERHSPDYLIGTFSGKTDPRVINNGVDIVLSGAQDTSVFVLSLDDEGKLTGKEVNPEMLYLLPSDKDYFKYFYPIYENIEKFYDNEIVENQTELLKADSFFGPSGYATLFHKFQIETSGADISLFAPVNGDNDIIGEGILRRKKIVSIFRYISNEPMRLATIQLTGQEIKNILEVYYSGWFNRLGSAEDDLINVNRSKANGRLYPSSYSRNYSASGINYTVNLTKPKGSMINDIVISNGEKFRTDESYSVAVFANRLNSHGETFLTVTNIPATERNGRITYTSDSDYVELFIQWLEKQQTIDIEPENNWKLLPEKWIESSAARIRAEVLAD